MKLAAAYALADLAKEDVPDDVKAAYNDLTPGTVEGIIPAFDYRALLELHRCCQSCHGRRGSSTNSDIEQYRNQLERLLGRER